MSKRIPFPEGIIHQTHATIRDAFEHRDPLIVETGHMGNMNITGILTALIQDTGRFVERYASDLLYGIDYIRTLCESVYPVEEPIDEIYSFGLRKSGVDHGNFIMSRLVENKEAYGAYLQPEHTYRKILAVHIAVDPAKDSLGPAISCSLADITSSLYRLNPADKDENGKLRYAPFKKEGEEGGN